MRLTEQELRDLVCELRRQAWLHPEPGSPHYQTESRNPDFHRGFRAGLLTASAALETMIECPPPSREEH